MKHLACIATVVAILGVSVTGQATPTRQKEVLRNQAGITVTGELSVGKVSAAKVDNASRLNSWVRQQWKKAEPKFASARGEVVKVQLTSATKCELVFPAQRIKVKLGFKGSDEELQAIIDWLGSLEAQE